MPGSVARAACVCVLVLAACAVAACGPSPSPLHGPVVLITLGGVRADVLGAASRHPEWTPRLEAWWARQPSAWRGTAVVASSEPLVSLASLVTGVAPWQHQLLVPERPERRRALDTLAESLGRLGYRSRAAIPSFLHGPLGQGFEAADPPPDQEMVDLLAGLGDGDFVWLHLQDAELAHGRWRPGNGDRRLLLRHRLLAYADPGTAIPGAVRQRLWGVYERDVRGLDRKLAKLLDAIARGPAWGRTTVVLTASHGLELGEHGQVLYGENLGRESIEVPLFVRLPAAAGEVAEPEGSRVAQTRLWATIAEAAGGEAAPLHPPSLFHRSETPVLSELYARNGVNRFSLVATDPQAAEEAVQLHWSTRFAPAEPEYYLARRFEAGERASLLSEPPRRLLARLDEAFRHTPPLAGPPGTEPELRLERWTPEGVEPLSRPVEERELAALLRRLWTRFVDRERTPHEEQGVQPTPEG